MADVFGPPCVAIDFETSGFAAHSACAVGLARIEDGRVVEQFYSLVRPPSSRVLFTEIHGLTWPMLKNAPAFGDVWPRMQAFAALLVGQPTLRQRLRLGVLAALDQRIAVRYALAGMTPADTADYIGHHAKVAGRTDPLFSDDAITVIHNAARGYPRAVNNLALHALTAAFAAKTAIVDEKSARIAVTETGHD